MNKFATLILVIIITFSFGVDSYALFSDVSMSSSFFKAIDYAEKNRIVNGYVDGTFRPNNQISRAEFTKVVILTQFSLDDINSHTSKNKIFSDVPSNDWFFNFVAFARTNGIINGYGDLTFRPHQKISLAEALKIIIKTKNIDISNFKVGNDWFDQYIDFSIKSNLIGKNTYISDDPAHLLTRGEMVWIVYMLDANKLDTPIWVPEPETSWQWQLTGDIKTSYDADVYDIDLEDAPQHIIDDLHANGKKVICYFNGGTYEPYRSDSDQFLKASLGKKVDGWDDEKWLDVANYSKFAGIMEGRLNLAMQKKCDGVEPDNIDGFQNDSGFPITYEDQLKYNIWMAEQAHKRGLSVGLKNDLDQVDELVDYFDFAVNEECFEYNECEKLSPFIEGGKAVFHAEYQLSLDEFCKEASLLQFSSLKMEHELNGKRLSCKL